MKFTRTVITFLALASSFSEAQENSNAILNNEETQENSQVRLLASIRFKAVIYSLKENVKVEISVFFFPWLNFVSSSIKYRSQIFPIHQLTQFHSLYSFLRRYRS